MGGAVWVMGIRKCGMRYDNDEVLGDGVSYIMMKKKMLMGYWVFSFAGVVYVRRHSGRSGLSVHTMAGTGS